MIERPREVVSYRLRFFSLDLSSRRPRRLVFPCLPAALEPFRNLGFASFDLLIVFGGWLGRGGFFATVGVLAIFSSAVSSYPDESILRSTASKSSTTVTVASCSSSSNSISATGCWVKVDGPKSSIF